MKNYLITFANTETRTMCVVDDAVDPLAEIEKWQYDPEFNTETVVSIEEVNE